VGGRGAAAGSAEAESIRGEAAVWAKPTRGTPSNGTAVRTARARNARRGWEAMKETGRELENDRSSDRTDPRIGDR
jgi:hypothetical protein